MIPHLYVVVPYRDRATHLEEFVPAIHSFLDDQPHTIIIVEQTHKHKFNRGKLINIGFQLIDDAEACFVFHDVDMIPLEADYTPTPVPVHMATEAEQFGYKLPYPGYFGGVTMFPGYHFNMVNGFGNEYWGWGAEDDDLRHRCGLCSIPIGRRRGKFQSLPHENRDQENLGENRKRLGLFQQGQLDFTEDGLNTLEFCLSRTKGLTEPPYGYLKYTVAV